MTAPKGLEAIGGGGGGREREAVKGHSEEIVLAGGSALNIPGSRCPLDWPSVTPGPRPGAPFSST